jgi:hypothetical protein
MGERTHPLRFNHGWAAMNLSVDSSLAAITLIVLITSALIVLTIAKEDIEERYVILKNEFPERLKAQASLTSSEKMGFSFGILLREDFTLAEIQYSILCQRELPSLTNASVDSDLEDIAASVPAVSMLVKETGNDIVPFSKEEVEAEHGDEQFEGLFFDFPVVRMYTDPSLSSGVRTSFLFLEDSEETLYFQGCSDFYFNRLGGLFGFVLPDGTPVRSTIEELRIWRDEEATSYTSAAVVPTGWKDIYESPDFGTVAFEDVKKNEKFSVDFTVETPERPAGLIAQVIRVFADGELLHIQINLIE